MTCYKSRDTAAAQPRALERGRPGGDGGLRLNWARLDYERLAGVIFLLEKWRNFAGSHRARRSPPARRRLRLGQPPGGVASRRRLWMPSPPGSDALRPAGPERFLAGARLRRGAAAPRSSRGRPPAVDARGPRPGPRSLGTSCGRPTRCMRSSPSHTARRRSPGYPRSRSLLGRAFAFLAQGAVGRRVLPGGSTAAFLEGVRGGEPARRTSRRASWSRTR